MPLLPARHAPLAQVHFVFLHALVIGRGRAKDGNKKLLTTCAANCLAQTHRFLERAVFSDEAFNQAGWLKENNNGKCMAQKTLCCLFGANLLHFSACAAFRGDISCHVLRSFRELRTLCHSSAQSKDVLAPQDCVSSKNV